MRTHQITFTVRTTDSNTPKKGEQNLQLGLR